MAQNIALATDPCLVPLLTPKVSLVHDFPHLIQASCSLYVKVRTLTTIAGSLSRSLVNSVSKLAESKALVQLRTMAMGLDPDLK